jgi:uncharacterized protein YidB (DUF937 family)
MGLLDGMLGSVLSSAMGGGQAADPKAALVQGVLGMLLNQGGGAGGLAGALGGMLSGGQGSAGGMGALGNVLGGLMGGGQSAPAGNMAGGLGGLLEAFTKNGMGEHANSWQGTGANLPISPDQLSQVLGSLGASTDGSGGSMADILGQLAGKAGISREDAAGHLTEILPNLVDKLTPNGQVADTSGMDLGSIMQQVLGK